MHRGTFAVLAMPALVLALQSQGNAQSKPTPRKSSTHVSSGDAVDRTHSTWSDYAGAADGSQYSSLGQINRRNVGKLRVAWSYPTGDGSKYLFNPLVVERTMYVLAHDHSIVAIDATSG